MAGALALLGTEHALLVSSEDGLDELSISAPTRVVEVLDGEHAPLLGHAGGGGARRAPRRTRSRAATRDRTPRRRGAIFAGERGRAARPRGAQRRRRDLRGRQRRLACGRRARRRRRRSTTAARPRRSSAFVARTQELRRRDERARRRSSRAPARTWRGGAPTVPLGELERRRARPRAPDRAPSARRSTRPALSVIAEHKRRSPSAGVDPRGRRARGRRAAPTSAAAPRRCRSSPSAPNFGGSLDDLRAARAAARPADPAQGLRRRPVPGARVAPRPAPTRSC